MFLDGVVGAGGAPRPYVPCRTGDYSRLGVSRSAPIENAPVDSRVCYAGPNKVSEDGCRMDQVIVGFA